MKLFEMFGEAEIFFFLYFFVYGVISFADFLYKLITGTFKIKQESEK